MLVEVQLYSFFNLGARLGWVVNATTQPFTPGKETQYQLYRRLGGPLGRSGRFRTRFPGPSSRELLYLLRYAGPGMASVKVPANAHGPTEFRLHAKEYFRFMKERFVECV